MNTLRTTFHRHPKESAFLGAVVALLLTFVLFKPLTPAEAQDEPGESAEPTPVSTQTSSPAPESEPAGASAESPSTAESTTPTPSAESNESAPTPSQDQTTSSPPEESAPPETAAPKPEEPKKSEDSAPQPAPKPEESKDITLSFKGANIDKVIEWLAKETGKSVVKHPQARCQLTIVSASKLPRPEALQLVYQALELEGFVTVENERSLFIVPADKKPKIQPTVMPDDTGELPAGRTPVLQVIHLKHTAPKDMENKIKSILSESAKIETDDRAGRLMVTDYADNIRLLRELVAQLDVNTSEDSAVEIFPLDNIEAERLITILTPALNGGGDSDEQPGGIRMWSDESVNRLIVTAPNERVPEIRRLIEALDVEKPSDVTVRVIPVQHVSAEDLVDEIGPLYDSKSGAAEKDRVEVTANSRSNTIIVLSGSANYEALKQLVETLDVAEAQEKAAKAFPLKNADAEDVAQQLEELYSSTTSFNSRYVYYYGRGNDSNEKPTFVADRRQNTVIVQAAPAALPAIEEMIATLDKPLSGDTLAPQIFPLRYVSSEDIVEVLNELFLDGNNNSRDYWDPWYGGYSSFGNNSPDVGRLQGKIRITSEPYSNSIIVTANSPENMDAVVEILKQLDVPSQAGETTLRVPLRFAKAVKLANNINILFARGGSPPIRGGAPNNNQNNNQNNQPRRDDQNRSAFELEREREEATYFPWLGGQQDGGSGFFRGGRNNNNAIRPISDLIGRVRVVPDTRSNSVLVTSNVHFLPQVIKLIAELDAPTAQVLIEAKIVEVSSDFRDRLGVRWSPNGAQTFDSDDYDNSFIASGAGSYTRVFSGSALANSLKTGILDSNLNLDFLIQFLRQNSDSRVLAEPQVNVADNELGRLFVGSQVPFLSGALNTTEGGRNDSFEYRDVGIILEVTPHISNAEEVALKVRVESSSIRSGETLFGGAILDTRNFRTDLVVQSGRTLVLGGIIQQEDVDVIRKVPLLGSVPGLGWAFKKKDTITRDVELMVFLRPVVTRSPEEAMELTETVREKVPEIIQFEDTVRASAQ